MKAWADCSAGLDQLGLAENTLFIFYSDNGGNVHSNTPDSRQMQNIGPNHPKWAFVQDWKKWAGPEPPTNNAPLREGKGRIYEGGQRVPLMIRWPGKIEPGSITNAVAGPIDLYPTILDALGIAKPKSQIIDGESLLPVLTNTGGLKRKAYFTWFPHLIPAVSVRWGDWKLIRRFEPHPDYPEVRELYDLKNDIGETRNLAKEMPDKVKELDVLIDQFVKDTGALYPKPNPAFAETDITAGLVPRKCKLAKARGAIRVVGEGRLPFLGTAGGKLSGPVTLKLIARSTAGGEGRLQWKTKTQESFPSTGQTMPYKLPAGDDWQEIEVTLPIQGDAGVIRLYLPAEDTAVELRSIRYTDKTGRSKTWDFSGIAP